MKEFINEGSFVDNQSHTIFLAEWEAFIAGENFHNFCAEAT
jgi:hypothetical protein